MTRQMGRYRKRSRSEKAPLLAVAPAVSPLLDSCAIGGGDRRHIHHFAAMDRGDFIKAAGQRRHNPLLVVRVVVTPELEFRAVVERDARHIQREAALHAKDLVLVVAEIT